MQTIDGEYALLQAMFRQVLVDSTSAEPAHRADVARWLDRRGPEWFDDLLGMDGRLATTLRARISQRQAKHRGVATPQLAFEFNPQ